MKLGIISDSHHFLDAEGRLYNYHFVLQQQLECWAQLFDEVIVCAPLLEGPPPPMAARYSSSFRLLPVPPAGGTTAAAKLHLLSVLPAWWKALQQLLRQVDAVHIRCPNNISILGLLALQGSDVYRQAVYTGTWNGYPEEAVTYRWQRWFLRRLFRGPVAVYGDWPDQPPHVVPSFSPSYRQADWDGETQRVAQKVARLRGLRELPQPLRLVTVGRLSWNKEQDLVIRAVARLAQRGLRAELEILGEGVQQRMFEELVRVLGLSDRVRFHGYCAHARVRQYYREADFVVQAPVEEGYGKVPIEAFFHGTVPVLSDVNLSAELVGEGTRGRCFPPGDVEALADTLIDLSRRPAELARLIENGRSYARELTLEKWREHIRGMLERHWSVTLRPVPETVPAPHPS